MSFYQACTIIAVIVFFLFTTSLFIVIDVIAEFFTKPFDDEDE